MNRKNLCVLIGLSLSAASVQAQDFDDRWYFAPWIGYYGNDNARDTDDGSLYGSIGIGKFIAPSSSIDVFIDRTTRTRKPSPPLDGASWDNNGFGVSLRQHFGAWDSWRPYVMAGLGVTHSELDGSLEDSDWAGFAQVGLGLSYQWTERVKFRTEVAYRQDWDDFSLPDEDGYGDYMFNLGLAVALGGDEAPADMPDEVVEAPAPEADCSTMDDDGDGVNNCDDKCPATASGQVVGPDGCPQDVVIDLRGVEFKFDRPNQGESDIGPTLKEPSSEGIAVLDQAVDVLNRYPQVRVEVAGHTDAVGSDEYNQGLSERRSQIVYDYLTGHGVDGGRLAGPVGYGESRPVDTNDTSEGRQRNRRTELTPQQ